MPSWTNYYECMDFTLTWSLAQLFAVARGFCVLIASLEQKNLGYFLPAKINPQVLSS